MLMINFYVYELCFNMIYKIHGLCLNFVKNTSCSCFSREVSQIKIHRSYLRTIITQGIWSNWAILSIKHKLCEKLDNNNIIGTFSEIKARKINSMG